VRVGAAQPDRDRHGCRQQTGQRCQRSGQAAKPGADRDGEVDGVRAGQELAQRQQLGEFGRGQPAVPLHDRAADHGQRAAERHDACGEKGEEQRAGARRAGVWRVRAGWGHAHAAW